MKSPAHDTRQLLQHWRESVPNDRLAHLVRDVARAQMRALQMRLAQHGVSFGHWSFLRVLWIKDGLTQKELSALTGVMDPTTFAAVKSMESMGLIERRRGRPAAAIAAYRQALQRDPDHAESHQNLAVASLLTGDIQGARAGFRAAILALEARGDTAAAAALRESAGALVKLDG